MSPFAQAIVIITLFTVIDIITDIYNERRYAKKSGYNCATCKNWKCCKHYCDRKREEH